MPSPPYPILFVLANLGGGGAERAIVNLANRLDRALFEPHVALFRREGPFLADLADDINTYEIQPMEKGFLAKNWERVRGLCRIYHAIKPALIMSVLWQTNVVTLFAATLCRFRCPIVINEQVAPKENLASEWHRYLFWPLAGFLYRRAARIVTISQGISNELAERLSLPRSSVAVIPNPVDVDRVRAAAEAEVAPPREGRPLLVAVGRLTPQKDFPTLLRAVAQVVLTLPVDLLLIGEGPERSNLGVLIAELQLQPYVRLIGFQSNPYMYMKQAQLFILSSRWEGFGNVLVEAMALGVPVIATDCPYGPREILEDGKYGVLVPIGDEEALAQAILALLQDPDKRGDLSRAAQRRAEDFSLTRIVPMYEHLFLEIFRQERV